MVSVLWTLNLLVSLKARRRQQRSKDKKQNLLIGREATNFLLNESLKLRVVDPERSKQLYSDARKLAERGRFHLSKRHRILFCKTCKTPFSNQTVKVRLNSQKKQIHYQCLICKSEKRFGYSSRKIIGEK